MPSSPAASRLRLVPIVLGQAIGVACGVAGVKVNSRFVPPEVLGIYGVFLTFVPIGMWVVHAGLVKFTGRHWAGSPHRAGLLREIVGAWARRLPWLMLAAAGAAWAMQSLTHSGWPVLALTLFIAASLLTLGALAQAALQAERAHWRDCLISVSSSLTRTFLAPLCYLLAGGAITALWFGFCGHALVVAVVAVWAVRTYWRQTSDASRARELTSVYEGPLFIALALAGWTLAGLNRWLVARTFGPTEAGYFTLAGGAAVVLASTLGSVCIQYFQPGFFAVGDAGPSAGRDLARRVDGVAAAYTLLGIAVIGTFHLLAPALVGPLINPNYAAALPWILPAGFFTVATTTGIFFQSMLLAGKRERACGIVDLASAAVLAGGCIIAVLVGRSCFVTWLLLTPLIPWLVNRPLARHYLLGPLAIAASAG